jgi:uncharacterized protein YxjI
MGKKTLKLTFENKIELIQDISYLWDMWLKSRSFLGADSYVVEVGMKSDIIIIISMAIAIVTSFSMFNIV